MHCPRCNKEVDTTFGNYCEHCGLDFDSTTTIDDRLRLEETFKPNVDDTTDYFKSVAYCTRCGGKMVDARSDKCPACRRQVLHMRWVTASKRTSAGIGLLVVGTVLEAIAIALFISSSAPFVGPYLLYNAFLVLALGGVFTAVGIPLLVTGRLRVKECID